MQPEIFLAPNQPFVVALNTATTARLPSMCDRIARALNKRGLSVQVIDTSSLPDCKDFEFKYKQGLVKSQVIILQGSFYIVSGAKNGGKSLFSAKSVRPQLSFLLDYETSLHKGWESKKVLHPDDLLALPKRAFGTDNHCRFFIEQDIDEVYACGRIVDVVLGCYL